MPTTRVTIHLPTRRIPAILTTDRAEGDGRPVLVLEGDENFDDPDGGQGPRDVTPYGLAATLLLDTDPDPEAERLLERWEALCGSLRERHGLTMAEEWLAAGGWTNGSVWTQETGNGKVRKLVDELDRAPLEPAVVKHVADNSDAKDVEGASWTFPDGSGVFDIGGTWATFGPDAHTEAGFVLNPRDRRALRRLRRELGRVYRRETTAKPLPSGWARVHVEGWSESVAWNIEAATEVLSAHEDGAGTTINGDAKVTAAVDRAAGEGEP